MPTGFPPYIQTNSSGDSYNYGGVPPEIAIEEQALNRKQQIANLLLQSGMQPQQQGQMVGRFYVPPSPVQGAAGLLQAGLGAYLTNRNDESRTKLAGKSNEMLAEAMRKYKASVADKQTTTELEGPGVPVRTAQPGEGFSAEELKQPTALYGTTQEALNELDKSRPAAFFQEGPRPTSTTSTPVTPEEKRQAIIEQLAMSTHPQAQRMGQIMLSELDKKEAREDTQAFQKGESQLNREARLQGQEIQLNQALMMGLITKEQKDQMLAMQQGQIKQTGDIAKMHDATQRDIASMDKEVGKTPPGYRQKDGNLEAIPGGPADLKQQGKREQATAALQSMTSDLDRLSVSANQILNHPGLAGITGLRGAVPDIPGTQAADARALLNKLKSQVGFSVLQNMRNNSKTGGALGNVSDNEGKRLENNLASVESAQSIDQMKRELQGIIEYANGSKGRLTSAYDTTYGEGTAAPPATGMTPTVPSFHDPDKQKRYEEFKKNHTP